MASSHQLGVLVWERLKTPRDKPIPATDCPYCGGEKAVAPVPKFPARLKFGGEANYIFGVCCECEEICGLSVLLEPPEGDLSLLEALEGDLSTSAYKFPRPLMSFAINSPRKPTLSAEDILVPPFMPPRVTSLFKQARHNYVLQNWDAAGMTYRKALEVTLQVKFKFSPSLKLVTMIQRLSNSEPGMFRIFAELLRRVGNDATHKEFDGTQVALMDSNIEQLTVYLFTVPEIKKQATGNLGSSPLGHAGDEPPLP